jgi:hypothetical protein
MWPIVKKELRENALYLLGAFAIVLLTLDINAFGSGWILVGFGRLLADKSATADFPLRAARSGDCLGRIIGDVWCAGCFLLSPAIALAQIYRERLRKTWPLLAHLPIPRSRTIFAKVLAGLLMYLIVLLPPMLLIIARLCTVGVWPGPILPYMFLPLPAYFLAGAMLYPAVFLAALRPAHWYATRWLPAFAAIPAWIAANSFIGSLSRLGYWHDPNFMFWRRIFLCELAIAVLSLTFVLWAIREQARTREY